MDGINIALVTNATQYGGKPAAFALAEAGLTVACHDRKFVDDSERRKFALANPGVTAMSEQVPEALIDAVTQRFGKVDVLVSNDLYVPPSGFIEDLSLDDYRATIEALLVRPFALCKAVVPQMKKRGNGRIILITSAAAANPIAKSTMYCSARGAANTLVVALGKELAPFNLQVYAIAPNFFESDETFPAEKWATVPEFRKSVEKLCPSQRLGTPREMGALVTFLASGNCDFITGQVIQFTGGWR